MAWVARLSCLGLTVLVTVEILYRIGSRDEDWNIRLVYGKRCAAALLCVLQAADVAWRQRTASAAVQCLLCILAGCLFMACVMDLWEHAVYRYVWWAAGGAACLILLWRLMLPYGEILACLTGFFSGPGIFNGAGIFSGAELFSRANLFSGEELSGLLLYILIQQCLFGRMYGRADSHAFCVCAVAQTAMGGEFRDYVLQMAAAFLGLALVQGIRKNIAANGNLKEPVPFLPYITVSFWLWVDFMAGKWYIY